MTDVVIQDLIANRKVKIKCRDLVQKIAIYKDHLAVNSEIVDNLCNIDSLERYFSTKKEGLQSNKLN